MRRLPASHCLILCLALGCATPKPRWNDRFRADWTESLQEFLNTNDRGGCKYLTRDRQAQFGLRIDRTGQIVAVRIVESSGVPELDLLAAESLQRAGPLDRAPPPEAFDGREHVELPYRLGMRAVAGRCKEGRQTSLTRQ